MKALSIRQPWASLIVNVGKDIENRDWPTRHRGRILIHAAKGMTHYEHDSAIDFAVRAIRAGHRDSSATKEVTLRDLGFAFDDLPRGGFIGSVEIVDCVTSSNSPWFQGKYGFVLRDPWVLPFIPFRGQLGIFEPDIDL